MSTIEEDLRFLITELQEERTSTGDELATCPIPGTFGEAWDLFRALQHAPIRARKRRVPRQAGQAAARDHRRGRHHLRGAHPPMRERFALRRVARGHHHAGGRCHRERREFPALGMLGAWPLLHRS